MFLAHHITTTIVLLRSLLVARPMMAAGSDTGYDPKKSKKSKNSMKTQVSDKTDSKKSKNSMKTQVSGHNMTKTIVFHMVFKFSRENESTCTRAHRVTWTQSHADTSRHL